MPNSDLLPSLLSKLYENQLALEASIMELSNWVGRCIASGRTAQRYAAIRPNVGAGHRRPHSEGVAGEASWW